MTADTAPDEVPEAGAGVNRNRRGVIPDQRPGSLVICNSSYGNCPNRAFDAILTPVFCAIGSRTPWNVLHTPSPQPQLQRQQHQRRAAGHLQLIEHLAAVVCMVDTLRPMRSAMRL